MKFANPLFLIALISLAIPILIHLFNFRKFKRVYFTNVRFLREVNLDTKAKNKLKNLLILISRILAVSFLVFAFAQPYIPQANATVRAGDKAVSIFIDNSFSMDAVGKNGTLLDEAKKSAKEIAAAYKASDRFQLLTNDFEGKHQRLVNREEFLELVDEVVSTPTVRSIEEITRRQQDALNTADGIQSGNKQAFIVSDFQRTITDLSMVKPDTAVNFRFVPVVAQNRNNVYIDSVWFTTPVRRINSPEALHIRLKNRSEQAVESVPMRLYVNGQAKTPASFSISANSSVDTIIYFTIREPGLQQGSVEINDYPVTFDDRFYFSFNVLKSIPVLAIDANTENNNIATFSNNYLKTLFGNDSAFVFTEVDETKVDYGAFADFHFILLNGLNSISSGLANELKKFVSDGGSLFVFPGVKADTKTYDELLLPLGAGSFQSIDTARTVVDKLYYENPLYDGVFEKQSGNIDLPAVYDHYKIALGNRTTGDVLMRLRNGDIFAVDYRSGKGSIYLCAVPIADEWSNFPKHAIFVPTLYQAALFSQPQHNLFYTIGAGENIDIGDPGVIGENVFHLSDPTNGFDIIPAHTVLDGHTILDVHKQVTKPGNYFVKLGNDQLTAIAFNYDRKESDLATFSVDELNTAITSSQLSNFSVVKSNAKGLTSTLTETDNGTRLWKACIWLVLFFLFCEILLIRFWKNSNILHTPVTPSQA